MLRKLSRYKFSIYFILVLLGFQILNFSITEYALTDLLGDVGIATVRWATILAFAFCLIDLPSIGRILTPRRHDTLPESWYLYMAWLLAITINSILIWWGVAVAISDKSMPIEAIQILPVFMAVIIWVVRILITGILAIYGERIFHQPRRAPQYPIFKHLEKDKHRR
jgi:hypothetical protein